MELVAYILQNADKVTIALLFVNAVLFWKLDRRLFRVEIKLGIVRDDKGR